MFCREYKGVEELLAILKFLIYISIVKPLKWIWEEKTPMMKV